MADRLRHSFATSVLVALIALFAAGRASAVDDPAPFPDMAKVVGDLLEKNYYDHKRFHPHILVERALRALETSEMSIDTTWLADTIVLHIGDAPRQKVNAPEPQSLADAMGIIEQVRIRIDAADFPPARRRDLDYALINGALLSLDPHTVLMPPEPAREFGEEIQGEFFGIGAYLVQDEGIIAIERVMAGLPADRAGVEDGDVILRIDGERTAGLSLEQAVKRIKGPKGSTVALTLERKGTDKPVELPIVRDLVQVISTRSYRSGDVGYVRMDDFSANTAHELYSAINDLQSRGPLAAFVIDLRFNGGGLLDAAKMISQFFLVKNKEIVRTVTVDGAPEKFSSSGRPILDAPMVALVSGGSASAAEILSGALQRNDRAVVAGTTTFGKGSVQAVKPLRDGSKLKLTIQEYQLPGGVSIQDVGITPDLRLVRHSQRKDGLLDLLPFTRDREVDDEFALANTHKYEHDSTFELGWLSAFQTKDEQKRSSLSARDFQPDQEAALVIDLLKAAVAQPGFADRAAQARKDGRQRQFLLDELKDPIAKRAEGEAASLALAFAKRDPPVEWGPQATPAPGKVSISYIGPDVIEAGAKTAMRFRVSNAGDHELGRLYGVINADKYSPLWEEELAVGRVPAGGSTEAAMIFRAPPRLYDGEERFSVELFVDGSPTPLTTLPVSVHIRGEPRGRDDSRRPDGVTGPYEVALRPHFSYSWRLDEPSGDGQLSPGETGTLSLTLRNDGDAPSAKTRLFVYKSDDPYVQLSEVRFILDQGLPVGGESTQSLKVTVLKDVKRAGVAVPFSADAVKLQIRAEESFEDDKSPEEISGVYRATIYSTLSIPINQAIAGGAVIQPEITLQSVETLPDGRIHLHVRVADDNARFVCLFQDEDKIDLQPWSVLAPAGDPGNEHDSSVKVGLYEPFVTLKPGLNNLRVVVSDKDDVTDVLPVRLWGAPAPAPVSANAPAPADPGAALP